MAQVSDNHARPALRPTSDPGERDGQAHPPCGGDAEHAAVAALAPLELRESAFGLLTAVQSFGSLAASAIAGLLWTAASPPVAFAYLVAWMVLALMGLLATRRNSG